MKLIFIFFICTCLFKKFKSYEKESPFIQRESTVLFENYENKTETENTEIQIDPTKVQSQTSKYCSFQNCPLYQGVCYEDKCICAYGFTTFQQENKPLIYCNYKQKSKIVAFFLEFFFPMGVGHIYAGKFYLAFIKFSLFLVFFCGMCGEMFILGLKMERMLICSALTILFDMCLWIVLQFVDITCYSFGIYKDGNGIDMI